MIKIKKMNGEGSITFKLRNGKKYYSGQVSVGYDENGKRIRKTFGAYKKSEVLEKVQNALAEINSKKFVIKKDITFGDFFYDWLFNHKKPKLKYKSFEQYETYYRLHIAPHPIANINLLDLTASDIENHINKIIKDNKIATQTAKTILTRIKTCLFFALDNNLIYKNPARNVKVIDAKINEVKKELKKTFTLEEQKKITEYLIEKISKNNYDDVELVILLDFFTGLRLGEILALTWEDFDGEKLNINKQIQSVYIYENGIKKREIKTLPPKTKLSNRIIYLIPQIIDILYKHKNNKKTKLIFSTEDGDYIDNKKPNRKLKSICKQLDIEPKRFHDIRHTFATRLFENDIKPKTVQVLLGHSNISTTMEIYTHVTNDEKIKGINKLKSLF